MPHRYIKIGITVVVLVLAFAGLLWSTLREGTEYYKHVDEVMASPEQWHGKRLQLHGWVVPGSIMRRPDSFDHIFKVENNGVVIDASYTGIAPDPFYKEGAEVVLKGQLTPTGFKTDPNGIMAKCPSKYEETRLQEAKKVS
jgi:cytochrome c-type biogenesis protein CcmE